MPDSWGVERAAPSFTSVLVRVNDGTGGSSS
ncbi:hypothetical protein Ae168Ps1_0246 [Pseudonocardia sp. Ae168_Ps1]|nr:hypothetical protein Ae150APs1_0250 [Pseudonocardia sp. Ae150A_Ps1]OLL77840.1 hypothetical protein Ae168Ps1_0246 [Pseudonocardia sp. Ae168_Ps1]OLL88036.1 hypothetical protein Ae263Ps1_5091c [Pseudonocardia sp. Ae263_Ps1]OLL91938.1 hypothetical protein Ae356Ps1_1835 [Pseudonocardia sp. Ae356_Ps1]